MPAAVTARQQADPARHAHDLAESEGLSLCRSNRSSSGFKCVYYDRRKGKRTKRYRAQLMHRFLGNFATAEEAALAVARRSAAKREQPPDMPENAVVKEEVVQPLMPNSAVVKFEYW